MPEEKCTRLADSRRHGLQRYESDLDIKRTINRNDQWF